MGSAEMLVLVISLQCVTTEYKRSHEEAVVDVMLCHSEHGWCEESKKIN